MISVLILTYNEFANLPDCLASVAWSDDILVLDSFSTDGTPALARSLGARVIQRAFTDFADQRNFGLEHGGLRHEWVLHLDADERVTPELRAEMEAVTAATTADAYRVALRVFFEGHWIRHASLYPSYQVRFGHRDRLRFKQVGHGQREDLPSGCLGTIRNDLLHFSFAKGYNDWFWRHNRYSTEEAEEGLSLLRHERPPWSQIFSGDVFARRRALKLLAPLVPFRGAARFLYVFFIRGGWLDGRRGYHVCRMMAVYEYMIMLKTKEIRRRTVGLPL